MSLADAWAPALNLPHGRLLRALEAHIYGFPRGRVVVHPRKKASVYWGGEMIFSAKDELETYFGIKGVASWRVDDHERCQCEDKNAVRSMLRLREDWESVSPDDLDWS